MTLVLGARVHYKLSSADVVQIDTHLPMNRGRQVRNRVQAGQVLPAEVVSIFPSGDTAYCNLRVSLDGQDTYWATSRGQGDGDGQWSLPPSA